MPALVAELVEAEAVPFLPVLRYKATGLRKREVWERTWELQRREDAGEAVGPIPVPPKYTAADFKSTDIWRLRGFWLYREGLYERETAQPRWFVHGLFA